MKLFFKHKESGEYEACFTYYEASQTKLKQFSLLFNEQELLEYNVLVNQRFQFDNQDCNFNLLKIDQIVLPIDRINFCLDLQLETYLKFLGEA